MTDGPAVRVVVDGNRPMDTVLHDLVAGVGVRP